MSEWIDINDRKPKPNIEVIVYTKNNNIAIDTYSGLDLGYEFCDFPDLVTHWMPLPELPK